MINSLLNEGSRALQASQRDMAKAASELLPGASREASVQPSTASDSSLLFVPVSEGLESSSTGGYAEPVVELKRQELLFNAAAEVVSTADQALGSLLNVSA